MQQGILDADALHCISPPAGLCPLPLRITQAAAQKPAAGNTGGILRPPLPGGGPAAPWREAQLEDYASDGLFGPDQAKAFESACLAWDPSSILRLPSTGGGHAAPWPKAQLADGPGDPAGRWASLADCPLPAKVALAPLPEEGGRPGMPSIGALGHDLGLCRPCNFMTKADGCRQGEACRFCHACGPGMARKRKREKKKILKGLQGLLRCSDEPECTMV